MWKDMLSSTTRSVGIDMSFHLNGRGLSIQEHMSCLGACCSMGEAARETVACTMLVFALLFAMLGCISFSLELCHTLLLKLEIS